MNLHARYAALYQAYGEALVYEMNLMEQAPHTTDPHARRELLVKYAEACAVSFALDRRLTELRDEMLAQKRPRFINRIFRKK